MGQKQKQLALDAGVMWHAEPCIFLSSFRAGALLWSNRWVKRVKKIAPPGTAVRKEPFKRPVKAAACMWQKTDGNYK